MFANLLIDHMLQFALGDELVSPRAEVHARLIRIAISE